MNYEHYNTITLFRRIHINKTNTLTECGICQYWYFKGIGSKHEAHLCNSCHDLMQKAKNFNHVAVASVK